MRVYHPKALVLAIGLQVVLLFHDVFHLDDFVGGWGRSFMAFLDPFFTPGPLDFGHPVVGLVHYILFGVVVYLTFK